MSLLQNAQNLIGVAEDGDKSRVTLQTLCLVDRKVRVRSDLADAVRTLEELTKEKEKLLIDITSSQALGLQGENGDPAKLSDAVQQSWDMINNEASAWDRAQGEKKSEKAKMEKSDKSEKSEKGNVEKRTKVAEKAALDQVGAGTGCEIGGRTRTLWIPLECPNASCCKLNS
ncbi:unnamed protein product [Effrenium voratum]|nr:unnamed protein product [Effrenium voratum]